MQPNIITILADDLGFSDIGCFGGEIETPNLDALAAGGFRASQFYNTARCCPARASLLTGLYPHQAGVGMMVYRDYGRGYEGGLNDRCVTFAEVLRDAGYQTMLSGKWHAGHERHSRPEVRGFDRFTGIYTHVDSYWKVLPGCEIYRDGERIIDAGMPPANPYRPGEPFYTTDYFSDVALEYIDERDKRRPFLLHLCYNAPHFPLEAPEALIEKYRGRYRKGWDVLKAEKLARMKAMGLVPPGQQMARATGFDSVKLEKYDFHCAIDSGELPAWDSLTDAEQDELDFRRAIYAAQVERMDQNIGRLVDRLRQHGLLNNTLVMFMSDNGCSGELGPFGCNWPDYHSGNHAEWRREGGWATSQGQCWASLSNTPLRKFKIFVHEGGIASPFIAHWPQCFTDAGSMCTDQTFHLVDVMPTLCEIAGADYPDKGVHPMQGISMLPWMKDPQHAAQTRTLFWQHEINAAVREGNWKLVTSNDRDDSAWELYDLSSDRSESLDLWEEHPEMTERLIRQWKHWAANSDVFPWPEERENLRRIGWPPE